MVHKYNWLLLTILLMVVCGSGTAAAQEVKYYYNPSNSNTCYIDTTSKSRNGNFATATIRWDFHDEWAYQGIAYISMDLKADCSKNSMTILRSRFYSSSDKLIREDLSPQPLTFSPGTKHQITFEIVCDLKTARQTLQETFITLNDSKTIQHP